MTSPAPAPVPDKRLGLFLTFGLTGVTAWIASETSRNAQPFYAMLDKPVWAPPAWVFGPVWTVLYTMIAVAAWRIWKTAGPTAGRAALGMYLAQLVLNALWSWLFFGLNDGLWATVEVVAFWIGIAITIALFRPIDRTASTLLLPYLVWVTFATALCVTVWQRNPALL